MRPSTEFEKLQALWDVKLKESGFDDLEQRDGRLKSWSNRYKTAEPTKRQAKEEYYRAAGQFLYDHKFNHPAERRIWDLHSQGMARLPIVEVLREEGLWFDEQKQVLRKSRYKKRLDSRPNSFGVQQVIESLRDLMIKKIEDDRNSRQKDSKE